LHGAILRPTDRHGRSIGQKRTASKRRGSDGLLGAVQAAMSAPWAMVQRFSHGHVRLLRSASFTHSAFPSASKSMRHVPNASSGWMSPACAPRESGRNAFSDATATPHPSLQPPSMRDGGSARAAPTPGRRNQRSTLGVSPLRRFDEAHPPNKLTPLYDWLVNASTRRTGFAGSRPCEPDATSVVQFSAVHRDQRQWCTRPMLAT
jgi:hypothetical protein